MHYFFICICLSLSLLSFGQQNTKTTEELLVEKKVITWSDSTFKKYTKSAFTNFKANYTDEYTMLKLSIESLERSKAKTIRNYREGNLALSEEDFELKMLDYKKKIEKAKRVVQRFKPKVTSYTIIYTAYFLLSNNTNQKLVYKLTLNDDFEILKSQNLTELPSGVTVLLI